MGGRGEAAPHSRALLRLPENRGDPSAHAPTRQLRDHLPPKAPARKPRAGGGARGGGRGERAQIPDARAEEGWGQGRLPPRLRPRTARVAAHRPPADEMTGESPLRSVPIGDLPGGAGAAFRMKRGLAGGRFPPPGAAGRAGACVVGSLHVCRGRGLPALRGPALGPAPASASFRTRGAGREEGRPASGWPRLRSLPLGAGEGAPPAASPLERACERRAPLGRADLGTKFKDFKSTTSWRLLEDSAP